MLLYIEKKNNNNNDNDRKQCKQKHTSNMLRARNSLFFIDSRKMHEKNQFISYVFLMAWTSDELTISKSYSACCMHYTDEVNYVISIFHLNRNYCTKHFYDLVKCDTDSHVNRTMLRNTVELCVHIERIMFLIPNMNLKLH